MEGNNVRATGFWYVRQREPKNFKKDFLMNPPQDEMLKYIEDVTAGWDDAYSKKIEFIPLLKKAYPYCSWKIIEMDYIRDITEELAIKLIYENVKQAEN